MEASSSTDNPYVAVVVKKLRNLKKKVEKVSKLDGELKAGKPLNSDQLQSIKSLGELERSLADIESIKVQLEEVAAAAEKEKGGRNAEVIAVGTDMSAGGSNSTDVGSSTETSTAEIGTCTPSKKFKHETSQCEPRSNASAPAVSEDGVLPSAVETLLEVLHVCANYQQRMSGKTLSASTGPDPALSLKLPDEVDYFGKALLGRTSFGPFTDTLTNSSRLLSQYLNKVSGLD